MCKLGLVSHKQAYTKYPKSRREMLTTQWYVYNSVEVATLQNKNQKVEAINQALDIYQIASRLIHIIY